MSRKLGQGVYSDDEIEQIIGIGALETKFVLKEIRETIRGSPLLATGLVFAFGILVGVSLGQVRKR
ncbi:hypothetical protein [[Eubacterium] cellulosolvens]